MAYYVECSLAQSRLDGVHSLHAACRGILKQTTTDTEHARSRIYVVEKNTLHHDLAYPQVASLAFDLSKTR